MSSHQTRRPKQGSSPGLPPLHGIAIGVLAAVATGFAAARAIRWKRQLPNGKPEEQSGIHLLVHEREFEKEGESGLQCPAESTGRGPCDIEKLVIDLDPGDYGNKDGLLILKVGAGEYRSWSQGEARGEEEIAWARADEKRETKTADDWKTSRNDNEGDELSRIDFNPKTDLNLDGASLKLLHTVLLGTSEGKGKEKDRAEEENVLSLVADEDTGEDGADDRRFAGPPGSPLLLSGTFVSLLDELSNSRYDVDLSTTSSSSFSDSVSECSMQEVSSAPVKPLGLSDETMEGTEMTANSGVVGNVNDKVTGEENDWSSKQEANKEIEVLETEEQWYSQLGQQRLDSVIGLPDSRVGHENLPEREPLRQDIGSNGLLASLVDMVDVEILPDSVIGLTESSICHDERQDKAPCPLEIGRDIATLQPNGHNIPMAENIQNAIIAIIACNKTGGDNSLDNSSNILVLNSNGSEALSQEMPSLTTGLMGGLDNEEGSKSNFEGGRLHGEEQLLPEMPSVKADIMKGSQLEEEPAMDAGRDDGLQAATSENASCDSTGHHVTKEKVKFDTDDRVSDSEILAIAEPMQELIVSQDGSTQFLKDKKPGMLCGALDFAAVEKMETDKEQPRWLPGSLHKSRGEDAADLEISSNNVEHSSGSTSDRKESELAEFDDIGQESGGTQQQEIDEIVDAKITSNVLEEVAHLTHSQHLLGSVGRGLDQVFAERALDSKSRATFSIKSFRYLPANLGLICLLIGILSFVLQYFVGLSFNQRSEPIINGSF